MSLRSPIAQEEPLDHSAGPEGDLSGPRASQKGAPASKPKAQQSPTKGPEGSRLSGDELDVDESEQSKHELLAESKNKSGFLIQTALLLVINFALCIGLLAWAYWDQRNAKIFYRSMKGASVGWILMMGVIMLRIVFGLAGRHMRPFVKLGYLLDLTGSVLAVFLLYFYFDTVWQDQYVFDGVYVAVVTVGFFASAFGLLVGLLITRASYSPVVAAVVMIAFDAAALFTFYLKYDSVLLRVSRLSGIFVFLIFVDLYWAFEARQILKYRAHKYYSDDSFLCYFSFWTDWFSYFWLDSLNNSKLIKKLKKKRAKMQKEQKQQTEQPRQSKKPAAMQAAAKQVDVEANQKQPVGKSVRQLSDVAFQPSERASDFEKPLDL